MQERRLLAVLMTDVYGYGAHVSRGEEDSELRIGSDLTTFAEICCAHHGHVVCDRGDGLKMTFESPVNAMRAALEMQAQVFFRNAKPDPNRRIVRHRMGLHVGDVLFAEGRPTGYAVTVAARLEQRASPGEICFSDEVFRVVRPAISFPSRFVGVEELKNLRQPVKIWMTMREDVFSVPGAGPSREVRPASARVGWRASVGLVAFCVAVSMLGTYVLVHLLAPRAAAEGPRFTGSVDLTQRDAAEESPPPAELPKKENPRPGRFVGAAAVEDVRPDPAPPEESGPVEPPIRPDAVVPPIGPDAVVPPIEPGAVVPPIEPPIPPN